MIVKRAVVAVVLAAVVVSPALAQARKGGSGKAGGAFETGSFYAGPRVWLGNLNGAVAIGGQIEKGFTQPGAFGPGIVAGGVGVDWYGWNQSYGTLGEFRYTVIPIQLFGNYHFVVQSDKRFDPYVGLALVYSHYSASWSGSALAPGVSATSSTTDLAGQVGLRYFLTDSFAVQGQVGFGYGTLGLGATWRF
jgi:hypothetical protein